MVSYEVSYDSHCKYLPRAHGIKKGRISPTLPPTCGVKGVLSLTGNTIESPRLKYGIPSSRRQREAMGYSQAGLAEILGVGRDTVKRGEFGRDPIPYRVPDEMQGIARRRIAEIEKSLEA